MQCPWMDAFLFVMQCLFSLFFWLALLCLLGAIVFEAVAQEAHSEDAVSKGLLKEIAFGPGTLDISGSLRLRSEFLDHFNVKQYGTKDSDNLLLERVRLNFDYYFQDDLHAFVQVQDAHFWFSELHLRDFGQVCPYQNPLDLREGYIEWKRKNDSWFGFKIGRQTITYRDGRVWGPGDWGNTGRYTWDAVKFYFDTDFLDTDLITAKQVISDKHHFDDTHYDFEAYGIYSHFNNLPIDLDLFYLLKHDNQGISIKGVNYGDLQAHAVGVYTGGEFGYHFDWSMLGAYQFGERAKEKIDAYGINARLGCTFDVPGKPRLGLEYTCASGDDDPDDEKYQTFDGLFGGIDRFYGRMNLFAWMNLEDYQASFSIHPMKTMNITVDYHYFQLAAKEDAWYYGNSRPIRQDATGMSGSDLGHEVDLLTKWNINAYFELFCGYSHFFSGSFVQSTGNHDDADWVFFQITLSF